MINSTIEIEFRKGWFVRIDSCHALDESVLRITQVRPRSHDLIDEYLIRELPSPCDCRHFVLFRLNSNRKPSEHQDDVYDVYFSAGDRECCCPGYHAHGPVCKHIQALEHLMDQDELPKLTEDYEELIRRDREALEQMEVSRCSPE